MIVNAAWFVPNNIIARDLMRPKKEIEKYFEKYGKKLGSHPNRFAKNLLLEDLNVFYYFLDFKLSFLHVSCNYYL